MMLQADTAREQTQAVRDRFIKNQSVSQNIRNALHLIEESIKESVKKGKFQASVEVDLNYREEYLLEFEISEVRNHLKEHGYTKIESYTKVYRKRWDGKDGIFTRYEIEW